MPAGEVGVVQRLPWKGGAESLSPCVSLRTCSHTLAGAQTPQTNSHGCRDAQRHKMQSPCLTPRRSRGHRHWALQHTETQIHAYILLLDVSCKRPERDLVGEQPLANSRSVRGEGVGGGGGWAPLFPLPNYLLLTFLPLGLFLAGRLREQEGPR